MVATEPLPTQVEEPKMDVPKEIFLKDYKKPDYFFDAVCTANFILAVHAMFYLWQRAWC